ncbi:UDP-N-acetylmuramoyl-L-alanyl-D-glutamate--2,6-diaminopimelate ligase [Candidatus Allofournierella excrementavium]|uniref:UDP-N-acetylmuramoyl-L-alanyl-D-glutamate--2, 6-diaminopimelate ligase n=1 Tax=Candidatus Allofournierella excrementavium TaxID=2838591 RepID=UPI00374EC74D
MKLSQLMEGLDYLVLQGDAETEVADVAYDSRKVQPGFAFVCVVGTNRDSHDYAEDVAAAGASVLVIQHKLDEMPAGVTVVQVENSRHALAIMSCNLFGNPAKKMTMIGVTGTKGKTTTAHMIQAALNAAGKTCGIIGTNGTAFAGERHALANTTPESYELQKLFSEMLAAGCDSVVMEVSSQGLMMSRVDGIHFDVGVFTNLYPDHIGGPGEHQSFEEYRAWKGQLFRRCDVGVVNVDDKNCNTLLAGHTCRLVSYAMHKDADFVGSGLELERGENFLGISYQLSGVWNARVRVNMPGEFSVYNSLAALAVGQVLGLEMEAVCKGLEQVSVKGRVELVPVSKRFTVLIDFAHNEAGTENLLTTLRAYQPKRLVVLFGCGGDRSRLRRYGMGEVASRLADFLILTEDNNRFEEVEAILADIKIGIAQGRPDVPCVEIPDRLDALHYALDHAQDGDMIAVIGKGHETYRDRKGKKTPFLERELLLEYAQQIGLE